MVPLGALTIFAGTAATAAGPHAGGSPGQRIHRLHFKGADTLMWVIHEHATIAAVFGVAVIAVWLLRRRRGADQDVLEPLTVLGVLLAAQGLVGSVQYELKLPTDMVWVHVTLATARGWCCCGRSRSLGGWCPAKPRCRAPCHSLLAPVSPRSHRVPRPGPVRWPPAGALLPLRSSCE